MYMRRATEKKKKKKKKHSLRGYVPHYILLESPLFARRMLSLEK